MKTRAGFVSNSSSSSFVLVIEKEWFQECLTQADAYVKHVINQINEGEEEVLGVPAAILSGWYSASGEGYLDQIEAYESEDLEDDYLDGRYQAVETFEDLVKKEPKKFFLHTEDL